MTSQPSPIFVKTYDLMLWLTPTVTKFPKAQRLRLAVRLEGRLFDFHALLLRAARSQPRRPLLLLEADVDLEKLRLCLRLAQQTGCLSFVGYEHAARQVAEIGRLLGGWLKSTPTSAAERGGGPNRGRLLEQ
jgi:hypothetical protein